jgi:hypothetical protein
MLDKILHFKNILWAVLVLICLLAVVIGLIYCLVNPYPGERDIPVIQLGETAPKAERSQESQTGSDTADAGKLTALGKTKDKGEEYISSLTFLADHKNAAVVSYGADTGKVWLGEDGLIRMNSLDTLTIRFPGDGSIVSALNAAMIAKPSVLVILIGTDELASVDRDGFISGYEQFVRSLLAQSPDTQIICCSLSSVTIGYAGDVTAARINEANEWLQTVCTDLPVWYADTASAVCRDGVLLDEYASSDGISLNGAGVSAVFEYLRTHALS